MRIILLNQHGNKGKTRSLETRLKYSAAKKEKNHPQWKGDKVGYRGLHKWVKRYLGSPLKCEFCNKEKTTPKSIHWANKSHKYKRKLNDWLHLCVKCHRKYDKNYAEPKNID